MSPRFARMPIHEAPWADDRHDPLDIDNYADYLAGVASGVADLLASDDSRTADAFITGAQQALARFNATTRASKKTKRSTFRFAEQKEGTRPVTIFIVADASRIEAQKQLLGLIQWCMLTEWKRHENKHRPVYLIANEATNFKIHGLDSLLTWGREFGVRLHLIIQSLSAFRRVYGQDVLNTLLSETEIKQFLAGQREPETLKLTEDAILGQQSLISQGHSGGRNQGGIGISGTNYSENARPLMTADEIRRTDKTILVIRKNKPILTDLPPIAAIAPWRKQIGINPFYGKPFLRPVLLRIGGRDGSILKRLARLVCRTFGKGGMK